MFCKKPEHSSVIKVFKGAVLRCPVCYKSYHKQYRETHKEQRKIGQKAWRLLNKDRKRILDNTYRDKLRTEQPEVFKARYRNYAAKRKAAILQRTPKWLTEGAWIEIKWAYKIAVNRTKETGIKYEVDHIIPLQGDIVSGLHVPWNLQVITESSNRSKNKYL